MRTTICAAVLWAIGANGVHAQAAPAPAAASAPAAEDARDGAAAASAIDALVKRGRLSVHAAGVVQQARGVAQRLREARAHGHAPDIARLERLFRALVNLAEASQSRDEERALYAASARRLADVEAQIETSAAADAANTAGTR